VSFINELKRRNVFKVGVAYAIVSWLLAQAADLMMDNFGAPDWVIKSFLGFLIIGFPLALFFAWAFELTPQGIKKEKDVDRTQSISPQTGRKLDRTIIAFLLIAVVYFAWDNFNPATSTAPPATKTAQPSASTEYAAKTIAVLPFADLSQAKDQEWFADGLAEEILNALAKTPDLLVSSRTSSFRYKGSTLNIGEIAEEMGVAHVLEGSVRSSGNRIRVTAQLIRASDGFHLWSENYDRDVADMIEIQEDLARNIANALETTMDPEALAAMTRVGTRSVEAYEEYIRGLAGYLESFAGTSGDTGQHYIKGYEHFERARQIDPGFSAAHMNAALFWKSQLSPHRTNSGLTDIPPIQMLAKLNDRIDMAISTAPTEIDKKGFMAQKALVELRLLDALRLFREYLRERPNDENGWAALTEVSAFASDLTTRREALDHWRERSASDPFSAINFIADAYRAGLPSEGAQAGLQASQRWPNNSAVLYQTHRTLMWAGQIEEGKKIAERYQQLFPGERLLVRARQACAEGRRADVEAMLSAVDPNDNYAISSRWHLMKLLGLEKESAEVLKPFADSGVPFMMTSWLIYTKFDPKPFPAVMSVLQREGVQRPPAVDIPFKCPPPEQTSIAVLPFVNMSADAENEFFSDGISEEILNVLASIPDLKVAARTSAFAFKGTNTKVSEIAGELGVNHVLEGSVRKSGNQIRVTAQLIKADDGFHLWSANYDRELTNIFAIQDEIAGSIAEALKVSLKLKSGVAGNLTGTQSIEAYEHYLKGMSLWHERTVASLRQSIEEFNAAISLDPGFAKAYAGLALSWTVIEGYVTIDQEASRQKALNAANKALEIDPENVEALVALGAVATGQFRFSDSRMYMQRAIELNPSFATAHQWTGTSRLVTGDPEAALESLQKAWSLDPRSRIVAYNLAVTLQYLGRAQEAADVAREVIRFAPDFPESHKLLMHLAIAAGDCQSAEEHGNRLAGLLRKEFNATPVYLELCQSEDPAARAEAIDTILSWPASLQFSSPDNPVLSYPEDLVFMMVEIAEFEAALKLAEKNSDYFSHSVLTRPRAYRTVNGVKFYCDRRFQQLVAQSPVPPLEGKNACD
jgi:TolB-like protein/Flp pilus assembly protein TadD